LADQGQQADVQPQEGQGDAGLGLYDLNSVPEHLREHVAPHLKTIEGNVTKRFQEAADFRKQWEPYQGMGIDQVDPDQLKELLEFRELAQDPAAFKQWYDQVGQELGYAGGEPDEDFDLGDDGDMRAQLREELKAELMQEIAPIQEQFQSAQYEAAVQAERDKIEQELAGLEKQHGEFDRDAVLQFALSYGEDDPDAVAKGHADYVRITSGARNGLVEQKLAQPGTPETGGRPADTSAKPVTNFQDAHASAVEMLKRAAAT